MRGIDADDGALRNTSGDLGGDAAVAATDIEDAPWTAEVEEGENFLDHGFLQTRSAGVGSGIPFGHRIFPS